MLVNVNAEEVSLELDDLPFLSGEYNVHKCIFQFSQEYDNLTKMCLFTKFGVTYQKEIVNDECEIPYEVLEVDGRVIVGAYAYSITENKVDLRYSPKPACFDVVEGSYRKISEEGGALSPSEYDQLLNIINELINEIQNDYQKKLIAGHGIIIDESNIISVNSEDIDGNYEAGRNINISNKVISTTADPNIIESIYVNGEKQEPQNTNVNIEINSISVEDINDLFR